VKRLAIVMLTFLGLAMVADAAWIHVKARLAQVLLRAAWERVLDGAAPAEAKPWPWADTYPVARLTIDRAGGDYIVLAGSSGQAFAFAPGLLENTAKPGSDGNCVIAAHRDTHFADLRDVRDGDTLRVQRPDGRWFVYRVTGTRVVDRRETRVTRSNGAPRLTLITCYPFDAVVAGGPQRYVLTAAME
jgi:sortase A